MCCWRSRWKESSGNWRKDHQYRCPGTCRGSVTGSRGREPLLLLRTASWSIADQTNSRRCEPRYGADLPASGGWAPCERQSGHRRSLADRAKRFWQWLAPTLRAQDWASSIVGCKSASVRACQCVLSLPSGSASVSESIPPKGKISRVIFEACCEAVPRNSSSPSVGETVPDSTPFAVSRVTWRASMTSDWF